MPARKPHALNTRKETKAVRNARIAAESSTTPKSLLSKHPPEILKDHAIASTTWKHTIELYRETEGIIATAFDENIIIKYCLLEEECVWLYEIRAEVDELAAILASRLKKKSAEDLDDKTSASMWRQYDALRARTQGLDARLDGKRKLSVAISRDLYLTPRSRAGVAPEPKAPEKPTSETAKAMDGI